MDLIYLELPWGVRTRSTGGGAGLTNGHHLPEAGSDCSRVASVTFSRLISLA